MSSKKRYDAVVKVGEYQDRATGQMKARYENVGSVMMNENGHPFLILKRTFNPAGVMNPENRDSVIVSFFSVSETQQPDPAAGPAAQPQGAPVFNPNPPGIGQRQGAGVPNQDIPF